MRWSEVFVAIVPVIGYAVQYVERFSQQKTGDVKQEHAVVFVKDTLQLPPAAAGVLTDPDVDLALRTVISDVVTLQNLIAQRMPAPAPAK